MKNKTFITIIASLLIVSTACAFFAPRMLYKTFADAYILPIMKAEGTGERFEAYDITDSSLVRTELDDFSVGLPADYGFNSEKSDARSYFYHAEQMREYIEIHPKPDERPMRLSDIMIEDMWDLKLPLFRFGNLSKGCERIGNGQPDSLYGEMKCAVLLEENDFSFWNIDQGSAFCKLAIMQGTYTSGTDAYIYEREDLCGIIYIMDIHFSDTNEPAYDVCFEFYAADDLNTPYELTIITPSLENAYAIINSIEMQ